VGLHLPFLSSKIKIKQHNKWVSEWVSEWVAEHKVNVFSSIWCQELYTFSWCNQYICFALD
jgi:hypothetical protein